MHLSGVNDNFEARHYRTATTFASSWMSFDYTHRERHILQNMASQLLPDPNAPRMLIHRVIGNGLKQLLSCYSLSPEIGMLWITERFHVRQQVQNFVLGERVEKSGWHWGRF